MRHKNADPEDPNLSKFKKDDIVYIALSDLAHATGRKKGELKTNNRLQATNGYCRFRITKEASPFDKSVIIASITGDNNLINSAFPETQIRCVSNLFQKITTKPPAPEKTHTNTPTPC